MVSVQLLAIVSGRNVSCCLGNILMISKSNILSSSVLTVYCSHCLSAGEYQAFTQLCFIEINERLSARSTSIMLSVASALSFSNGKYSFRSGIITQLPPMLRSICFTISLSCFADIAQCTFFIESSFLYSLMLANAFLSSEKLFCDSVSLSPSPVSVIGSITSLRGSTMKLS